MHLMIAFSPVDGRYGPLTEKLRDYFSEGALIKYRLLVEIEYFIALCDLPLPQLKDFDRDGYENLRAIVKNFGNDDAHRVKEIEKKTNHDVKAVEYFLKEKFDELGLGAYKEFIHFGLTSQDINNTALPYSLKKAWFDILKPVFDEVLETLQQKARKWQKVPMLARTHGQPASPTIMGKEIYVFVVSFKGITIAHPANRKLRGTSVWNLKDARGKYFIREFIRVVKERGAGWVDYWWLRHGEKDATLKKSYVMRVPGEEMLVGAGYYVK